MEAILLRKCTDEIGEAATWLELSQSLLWVDIVTGILHEYIPDTETFIDHQLPDMVSTIIPTLNKQEVILALKRKLVCYHLKTKTLTTLVEIEADQPDLRPNDGKASPDGRIWLGVMHLSDHSETGSLYCIHPDLSLQKVLDKQCIPNGLVWDKSGTKMYYADSGKGCISEYEYNQLSGKILFKRISIQVPPEYGVPDGMTIDDDGMLWVAHWGGFGVYVWDPESGELITKIDVPVPNVASCTFGGKKQNQLFISTARSGLNSEELTRYPLSGSLFLIETAAKAGQNHYPFTIKNTAQ